MTDLEIDKCLALAIGWPTSKIVEVHVAGRKYIEVNRRCFSHKDWNVIGPIAERYDCFPFQRQVSNCQYGWETKAEPFQQFDTPQRAIALAVIEMKK